MATSTTTCSVFKGYPAKNNPVAGNVSVSGTVLFVGSASAGASTTAGDNAYLARIPNGAVIVDLIEDHTSNQTAQTIKFGLDRGVADGGAGNLSILIAAGAMALVNRRSVPATHNWGTPLTVSLSDLDPVRYSRLVATIISGSGAASVIVTFTITYRTDGPAGMPPNATTF